MKFCDKHWRMLRAAIETRGISHLVAGSSEEAHAAMKEDLQAYIDGRESIAPYDPLMSCHWMISSRAIELGGLYLMTGDHCPVCEAMKHLAGRPREEGSDEIVDAAWVERHWIDGPADAALDECKHRGLVTVS